MLTISGDPAITIDAISAAETQITAYQAAHNLNGDTVAKARKAKAGDLYEAVKALIPPTTGEVAMIADDDGTYYDYDIQPE